jgi:hypothetical protein
MSREGATVGFDRGAVRLADDPQWLPHHFDPGTKAIEFVHMPRAVHGATGFLNDHHIAADRPRRAIAQTDAIPSGPRAPLHFIFHSGLTFSTLIARALDCPGAAMTLKEPAILDDVIAYGFRGGTMAQVRGLLGQVLDLLARPFAPDEPVIVKTASVANGLATPIMDARPETRALCLHAPLPVFLGSIARKGLMGRLWGRRLFIGLRNARLADFGFAEKDLLGQTDLQIAALGWLAQQAIFARVVLRHGPERARSLDSETFAADPNAALRALADHFGLTLDPARIATIVDGPLFDRHAKTGEKFDMTRRSHEIAEATSMHRDEIEKVVIWTRAVAEAAGHSIDLGSPLLG